MSATLIQNGILCASEFALSIALTVFIIITVILTLLLIFLAASKNFRTVFFREKQKKKSSKKQSQAPALSEPSSQGVDTVPIEPAPKRKPTVRRSNSQPEYLSAIPTVPLGGMPTPAQTPARPRASRRAATEDAIEAQESTGSTYTTRSITITRARSTRAAQPTETTRASRNDKKR